MRIAILIAFSCIVGVVVGVAVGRMQMGEGVEFRLPESNGKPDESHSNTPHAQVAVDQELHDFGFMERNTKRSHEFVFTNQGDAPLELEVGETSCKCTLGEIANGRVAPGESVPVKLEWHATSNEPEFRATATIHTNDPLRPTVRLSVEGKVTDATSFHPQQFAFGNIPVGTTRQAEVKLVSFRKGPFEIRGHSLRPAEFAKHFHVTIDEMPLSEFPTEGVVAGRVIRVMTKPTLPFGPINSWLTIETNLDTAESIDLPLAGKVVSDISLFGRGYDEKKDVLHMGPIIGREGGAGKLTAYIYGHHESSIQLALKEANPNYLKVEIGERTEKDDLSIIPLTIRIPKGTPPAVFLGDGQSEMGKIVLATTHPRVPEISIAVKFTVQ